MNRWYFSITVTRSAISGTVFLLLAAVCLAQSMPAPLAEPCGEVVIIATQRRSTMRYAFVHPFGFGSKSIDAKDRAECSERDR